jgi:hypothetical protein
LKLAWRGRTGSPDRDFVSIDSRRGEEKFFENPIPRKESSDLGEAELAMRGNHPGSLSYLAPV